MEVLDFGDADGLSSFLGVIHKILESKGPNLWATDQYLLPDQWWHQIRNKVHNECDVLEIILKPPPHLRSMEKQSSMKPVPGAKMFRDCGGVLCRNNP